MDKIRSHLFVISLSATGMLFGHWLAGHLPELSPSAAAEQASAPQVVSAHALEVVGADGRRQILMGTSGEGSPAIWLFDKNGKARISVGLYGDNNAGVVLNDEHERAVQIFRTVGPRSSPVLVMKSEGRDRIVMGPDGAGQEPFFVLYDAAGVKQTVFGRY